MPPCEASEAIEEGCRDSLTAGGKPFILAEDNQWLRLMVLAGLLSRHFGK